MKKKYELLAPAGNFESLIAAVDNGADAVYFGLKEFSMRAGSRNFKVGDLKRIEKICSPKKVKRYLTLNVIIYDEEIKKLEGLIKKVKPFVDAIICWDFFVIELCRKYKIPFHISTQASVSNIESARFYKSLGAERIVLARELNLKQIKNISKKVNIGIETFCHGAMCVSISGRCFTSQFQTNKSANRGLCTHPCRRQYKVIDLTDKSKELLLENNRVMSAKDLCTLPFISKLKKSGIVSFKIEGRNRSPEYVATVVREYRKALDNNLEKREIGNSLEELKKVYHRGFSEGFYLGYPTSDDFSKSENGEQTTEKLYIGRVDKYWPKAEVAGITMHHGKLKVGEDIYVMGKETGIKRVKVEKIEVNNKEISSCKKGDFVGIKISGVRKRDSIYLIKERVINL